MAASDQKNQRKERIVPGVEAKRTARASAAAGAVGSSRVRVEQRTPGPANARQAPKRASAGSRSSGRKASSAPSSPPANQTGDERFIHWLREQWQRLEPHQQQQFYSSILLLLSLVILGALTIFRQAFILKEFYAFFTAFFGWSAYMLALGLLALAGALLIEGLLQRSLLRRSLVGGLALLGLLVLAESQLLFGGETGGFLGALLIWPLHNWPAAVGHILILGLMVLVSIVTFRITFGHILAAARFVRQLFADHVERPARSGSGEGARGPSPFLGQRPRYSRYGGQAQAGVGAGENEGTAQGTRAGMLRSSVSPSEPTMSEEDEDIIEFEPDFESDDDRQDDRASHRLRAGSLLRGPHPPPKPLNRQEYQAATRGAQQQPLPFDGEHPPQQPLHISAHNVVPNLPEMEPLTPNPLKRQSAAEASRGAQPRGAGQPPSLWKLPDLGLLNRPEDMKLQMLGEDTVALAKLIQDTLRSFRVEAEVRPEDISIGPTVIRFGIRPTGKPAMQPDEKGRLVPVRDASGNIVYESRTRVSRIMALQNDLALVLEARSIRMEAPVPGRPYVGVEIPNKNSRLVTLREILESKEYQSARAKSKLAVALGKDVAGAVRVGDLARMPHLLIAGATGAGKSVCINAMIATFLMQATPDDLRLLLVDPKMVELTHYNGVPHLLMPVVTEVDTVVGLLKNAIHEMERRYRLFSRLGVRNLDSYRKLRNERLARGDNSLQNLPAIVIIIDELADLMMTAPEEVEGLICRLAQLARATGIHLVVATQRPSVDVITGLIKANIPTRISFMVSSAIDSRTIIDMGGAERLLGRGDMLYLPADAGKPERIQGAFVADEEIERLVTYWKEQASQHRPGGSPEIEPGWEVHEQEAEESPLDDELLEQAEQVVREYGRASISLLQRRLRVGYARAARLIDLLEAHGIIGPQESGGRAREVLESRPSFGGGRYEGEGRTMADEVEEIIAEERARQEALRRQQERQQREPRAAANDNDQPAAEE
ncbi:DNA translocase FtsK [Thermogemmatispora carboxidivorans]|uniref:DNA translocase FtsK n=1 Tax=Thermogemmatispora carboxidivorans TaxID=1382306 RepID=UPI00069BD48D|nr:DNA translocase FtsK [Thermogemmatispora carboxidivorans]